jgi:Helicase associated domain
MANCVVASHFFFLFRTWEENYQALLLYKKEHGDCLVPHKYDKDRVLSKWICHLRENYHAGQLPKDRVEALEAVGEFVGEPYICNHIQYGTSPLRFVRRSGFIWSPHEEKWNKSYLRLVEFWKENGHSKVPTNYPPDIALGKWVSRQREDMSGGYISGELGLSCEISSKTQICLTASLPNNKQNKGVKRCDTHLLAYERLQGMPLLMND